MPDRILKKGEINARGTDGSEEENIGAALDSFGLVCMNVVHWETGRGRKPMLQLDKYYKFLF